MKPINRFLDRAAGILGTVFVVGAVVTAVFGDSSSSAWAPTVALAFGASLAVVGIATLIAPDKFRPRTKRATSGYRTFGYCKCHMLVRRNSLRSITAWHLTSISRQTFASALRPPARPLGSVMPLTTSVKHF